MLFDRTTQQVSADSGGLPAPELPQTNTVVSVVVSELTGSSPSPSSPPTTDPLPPTSSEPSTKVSDTHVPRRTATGDTPNSESTLQDAGPAAGSVSQVDTLYLGADEHRRLGRDVGQLACHALELSRPNEYESLVRPDEHSIVDDPLLLRTPYIINTKYMVLICIQCKHAVTPDRASTHAHRLHRMCKVPDSFVAELDKKFRALKSEKIHPGSMIQPIFGLAVPVQQYLVCARCLRGYSNHSSWHSHACEDPLVGLNGRPPYFHSFVQMFFRGPRLCYFPVDTPVSGGLP